MSDSTRAGSTWTIGPAEAASLPRPHDNLATPILDRHGVEIEYYAPRGVDKQTPHDRDELYVVAAGEASFAAGAANRHVCAGELIFVPAGEPHRFEDIGEGFAVWVVFFGPSGTGVSRPR